MANNQVDFSLFPGEIHALIGENGAGKSTLVGILAGLIQPDHGEIRIRGQRIQGMTPRRAVELGMGIVHQHFRLVLPLTVKENIFLGRELTRGPGLIDRRKEYQRVSDLIQSLNFQLDPDSIVGDLPVGAKQKVEILKALIHGASILILDEPTAVLTPKESGELMETMRALKAKNTTMIFVSHHLKEVLAVADRVTVMRNGAVAGIRDIGETSPSDLARLMVGRDINLQRAYSPGSPGEVHLDIKGLCVPGKQWSPGLKDMNLCIRGGEILGIAGVDGNGQTELAEAVTGLRPATTGSISLLGQEVTHKGVRERKEMGLSHIPEDRLKQGLISEMTLEENGILGSHFSQGVYHRGIISRRGMRENFYRLARAFNLTPPFPGIKVSVLSGGNQQKLVLGREIRETSRVIIAAQPSRGLDIGATEVVHQALIKARDNGAAILLISTDLGEIVSLSDRITVLFNGEITGNLSRTDYDEFTLAILGETLGLLMTGGDELS